MSSTVVSLRRYETEKQYKSHYEQKSYASCANFGSVKDSEICKPKKKRTPEELRKEMITSYMKLLSNNLIKEC